MHRPFLVVLSVVWQLSRKRCSEQTSSGCYRVFDGPPVLPRQVDQPAPLCPKPAAQRVGIVLASFAYRHSLLRITELTSERSITLTEWARVYRRAEDVYPARLCRYSPPRCQSTASPTCRFPTKPIRQMLNVALIRLILRPWHHGRRSAFDRLLAWPLSLTSCVNRGATFPMIRPSRFKIAGIVYRPSASHFDRSCRDQTSRLFSSRTVSRPL